MASSETLRMVYRLDGHSKKLIFRIYMFIIDDAERCGRVVSLTNAIKRISAITGVAVPAVRYIVMLEKYMHRDSSQTYYKRYMQRLKQRSSMGERSHTTQSVRNVSVTFEDMFEAFLYQVVPLVGKSMLLKVLRELGMKSKDLSDWRMLMESDDIKLKRVNYVRKIVPLRAQHPIVYVGEVYIPANLSQVSTESENPSSKSNFVISYAASASGFVPNGIFIRQVPLNGGDGWNAKNCEDYKQWIETRLIPSLPPKAVVAFGNSPHMVLNPLPLPISTKGEMINWLSRRQIPLGGDLRRITLYSLIRSHKPRGQLYKIIPIMLLRGFTVLQMPLDHPEFNPIEEIWAVIKQHIVDMAFDMTFDMTLNSLSDVVNAKILAVNEYRLLWAKAFHDVEQTEKQLVEIDDILDEMSNIITGHIKTL